MSKILKNKAFLSVSIWLILLIIFSIFGWAQTIAGGWILGMLFVIVAMYVIYNAIQKTQKKK